MGSVCRRAECQSGQDWQRAAGTQQRRRKDTDHRCEHDCWKEQATCFRRNEFLVYDAERHARRVPLRRSPSAHRILNLLQGQRTASCVYHATAGDFSEDPRDQSLNVSSACMFGVSRHRTQILHLSLRTDRGLFVSRQSDFAIFLMKTCASNWRSIGTPLSRLQTVIDGQESRRALDKMSKLHRSRLDTGLCTRRSGSSQLASDETLSRTACPGTELHCKPTRSVDQLCEMCPSSTLHSSSHCSNDVRLDTVIGISARGSETKVTSERERLHSKSGEGHDCRSRGMEASTKEGSTPTIVYNTVYNSPR